MVSELLFDYVPRHVWKVDRVINDKVWGLFGSLQESAGANRSEEMKNRSRIW